MLKQLMRIEEALGRRRDHPKNVSRMIDIDLLYCGDRKIEDERSQLPHPRLHLRKFVLQPLADIRPGLVLPGQAKTVRQLLEELKESGWYAKTSQAFAVLLPVQSVGVMGDGRTYENVIALRAVQTDDFMTADWSHLPYMLI